MTWEVKKLGEIAKIEYGYTQKASFDEIGPKFLRITDIQDNGVDWSTVPFCACNESDLQKYKLETGDIVFARTGATTGKSYLVHSPPNSVFASYLIRLKLISKKNFVPEFISYYFQTKAYWDKINTGMSGSAQGGFNASKLGGLLFSFPKSISEQLRIIAILDEAFENIARAKESAEKNLKNANEIFESYLQSVFENKGEGWEAKTLKDVCELKHGFAFAGNDFNTDYGDDKPIVLTPGNFHESANLYFTPQNTKRYTGKILNEWVFNKGDLVVVMTDLSSQMKILGKPAFIDYENILHNQRIGRFIFKNEGINKRFIYYYLQTQAYLTKIKETATGTMVKHTAPKRILKNKIFIPSIHNQNIIVAKLDALSAETKKLEAIYTQKLADLEELKKSILAKAFKGELTEALA